MKQVCILKRCPNKRYAPPAKLTEEQKEEILRQGPNTSTFEGQGEELHSTNNVDGPFSWAR